MVSSGVFLVVACAATALGVTLQEFRVVYEWYKLDFTWQDDEAKLDAYSRKMYEARNNVIQNVKIWGDDAFLTVPRSKSGVPATLVTVPSDASKSPSASPRLEPFPSWSFQEVGNCAHLQNVQAIEVDRDGFLWVADSGTVGEFSDFGDVDTKCPPKLLIFDIERRELVSQYEFPREFLRPASIFTDMVVDPRGNKTAYITAVTEIDAVIVVYSNDSRSARKVSGLPRVSPNSVAVNGTEVPLKLNKLSIALSLLKDTLFLSPSWQEMLYAVHAPDLMEKDISSAIRPVGRLPGLSYAIALDSEQILYYTVLERNSIGRWNTLREFEEGHNIIAHDNALLQFPSSFAFDRSQNIWALSNRFQTFLNGDVNLGVPNFRLMKAYTGSDSYMYSQPTSSATYLVSSVVLVVFLVLVSAR